MANGSEERPAARALLEGSDPLKTIDTGVFQSGAGETMTSAPGSHQPPPSEDPVVEVFLGGAPGQGERLELRALLGRGGMGRVLLATQGSLGRDVAVKVLHAAPSVYARTSLVREALVVSRLEHPNIVPVYALGQDDRGRPALVMKRIDGVPWSALIKDEQHPAWAARLGQERDRVGAHIRVLLAVCEAVELAHSKGVFHRDIKPDNVMLGEFGEVYVTDWGLAVSAGEVSTHGEAVLVGTPSMMAPEMLSGDPTQVDARTDVYLLGSSLHGALTGRPRHDGEQGDVLRRVEESLPAQYPSSIPPELAAICNRATARAPSERFPGVAAFRQALLDFLAHRSSLELSAAASERLGVLRELVERSSGPGERLPEDDTIRLQQVGSECRFGYEMALRSWPESEAARRGLGETLALLAFHELQHGSLAAGRRHMAALEAPEQRLLDALAQREQRERDGEHRAERLAQIEAEFDLSTEAKNRRAILGLILLPGVVLVCLIMVSELRGGGRVSVEAMLLNNTFVVLVMSAYTLVRRRALLSTAINQRVVGFLFALYATIFVHRLASLRAGTSVAGVINGDMAIFLVATATATIGITRVLWPAPAALFTGILVGTLFPALHVPAYAGAALFALGSFAFVWGRLRGSSLPAAWRRLFERGARHVQLLVDREPQRAHLARDAFLDLGVARADGHGDADGAPLLHGGAHRDARVVGHVARVEVAAVVEHRAQVAVAQIVVLFLADRQLVVVAVDGLLAAQPVGAAAGERRGHGPVGSLAGGLLLRRGRGLRGRGRVAAASRQREHRDKKRQGTHLNFASWRFFWSASTQLSLPTRGGPFFSRPRAEAPLAATRQKPRRARPLLPSPPRTPRRSRRAGRRPP